MRAVHDSTVACDNCTLLAAVERKRSTSTWCQWAYQSKSFTTAESFRQFLHQDLFKAELRAFLPSGDTWSHGPLLDPAREKLSAVWHEVVATIERHEDAVADGTLRVPGPPPARAVKRTRVTTEEIVHATKSMQINVALRIAEVLSELDELLLQLILQPISNFIRSVLPDTSTEGRKRVRHLPMRARNPRGMEHCVSALLQVADSDLCDRLVCSPPVTSIGKIC